MDGSSSHPTDATLGSYRMGKLSSASSDSVLKHLETCASCRQKIASLSVERGRPAPSRDTPAVGRVKPSSPNAEPVTPTKKKPRRPDEPLPAGLTDHPDYEVIRELGRGGMGVVYLARNRLMDREVVLKVMGQEIMEKPGLLDRFLQEIRSVAMLQHPNIVTAHSAFRLGNSIAFTMEYVDGLDLDKMVLARSAPLPVEYSAYVIQQAALGLQHAHERGMVHRDIKPGNLMVARQGDRAIVKILDFGLAKVTREQGAEGGITMAGQMLGTPHYIAPEQTIDAQSADIRADIYSLGCTLYFLLTGAPPFPRKSLYDILQAHHSVDATALNTVRSEVPAGLASLVAKMMAKDPADRFQTPSEVAKALAPFIKKGAGGASIGNMPAAGDLKKVSPAFTPGSGSHQSPTLLEGLVDIEEPFRPLRPPPLPHGVTPNSMPQTKPKPPIWLFATVGLVLLAGLLTGAAFLTRGSGKSASSDQVDFKPMFNDRLPDGGKEQWKDDLMNGSIWKIEDRIVKGQGSRAPEGQAILSTKRDDLTNFRLRLEVLNAPGVVREIRLRPGHDQGARPIRDMIRISVAGSKDDAGDDVPIGSIALGNKPFDTFRARSSSVPTGEFYDLEIRVGTHDVVTMVEGREVAKYTKPEGALVPYGIDLFTPRDSEIQLKNVSLAEEAGAKPVVIPTPPKTPRTPDLPKKNGERPFMPPEATKKRAFGGNTPKDQNQREAAVKKKQAQSNPSPGPELKKSEQVQPPQLPPPQGGPGPQPNRLPDVPKTVEPPKSQVPAGPFDFSIARFSPLVSSRAWKAWVPSDKNLISVDPVNGVTIQAGPNGNALLTEKSNYTSCTITLDVTISPDAEVYLVVRAKPETGGKSWKSLHTMIAAVDRKIGVWGLSTEYQPTLKRQVVNQKLALGQSIKLKLKVNEDARKCELYQDIKSIDSHIFDEISQSAFKTGAAGVIVKRGTAIVHSMVVE